MKFLRQKETKRKISFLMALAMMVSLLPVSPVAKAAQTKATVTIDGVQKQANISVSTFTNTASQAAITLKTETNKKFIATINKEDIDVSLTVQPASAVAINVTRDSDSECTITFPVNFGEFDKVSEVTVSAKNDAKLTEDVQGSSSSNVATNSAISDGSDNYLKKDIPVANAATGGNEKVQRQLEELMYGVKSYKGLKGLNNGFDNLNW